MFALSPYTIFDALERDPKFRVTKRRCGNAQQLLRMDVEENSEDFHIRFDIPGIKKEDMKVEVEDNLLEVSVNQHSKTDEQEQEEKNIQNFHYRERLDISGSRKLQLPENADLTSLVANHENGVLSIVIKKKEPVVPKRQSIQIN